MLIQCHSCNTKYRLNLERIPKRKTFVRCKNCGTPIYIDPTEEEETGSVVIPPQESGFPAQPEHSGSPLLAGVPSSGTPLVECPSCHSRYRVEPESLGRPGVKMKCTNCGAVFSPPVPEIFPAQVDQAGVGEPSIHQAPESSPGDREMPLPDEGKMDSMFDDLRPPQPTSDSGAGMSGDLPPPAETELGALDGERFEDEPPTPDPDSAYMDAVSFQEEGGEEAPASRGPIPEEQKSRFFLKPDQYKGSDMSSGEKPEGDLDLPPLPDEADGASVEDAPTVPVVQNEQPAIQVTEDRDEVPGQRKPFWSEPRILVFLAAASVVILLGAGVWGYWLATSPGRGGNYLLQYGQTHNLVMEDSLKGRYVTNRPSGKRLFVVNGVVDNLFSDGDHLRWIRIRGIAYADREQTKPVAQAAAYAGNLLDDAQLTHWDLPAIKAYYGFLNGRKETNLEIPSGTKVPYQLVFSGVTGKIERTMAEVISYNRLGKSIFVDAP